jgi:hypothetical protein
MNLVALTDGPTVPRMPQRVRHNVEGERMLFAHELEHVGHKANMWFIRLDR